MKHRYSTIFIVGICAILSSCIVYSHLERPYATGTITGKVVDTFGRPIADARVRGIYLRSWTVRIPSVGNDFMVAQTKTGADGSFTLIALKRVDLLEAIAPDSQVGELEQVRQSGNILIVRRTPIPAH